MPKKIALIDSNVKTKIYPLGLMKIAAWQKELGNEVKLFTYSNPPKTGFDEYWTSTTFTFDIPKVVRMLKEIRLFNRDKRFYVGGVSATLMPEEFEREGFEVHKGVIPEAEKYAPDYEILGYEPKYSITHTTRGCIRKCGFCVVKIIEPEFYSRKDWTKDLHPRAKEIQFYDNNWLAKPFDELLHDVKIIEDLVWRQKRITKIDFNQALDCRLMTDKMAATIAHLPMRPWRFSFDGLHEDGYFQDAIRRVVEYKKKYDNTTVGLEFVNNILFNWKDKPEEFYYRVREMSKLSDETGVAIKGFGMRYQPIMDTKSRRYVGKHWTRTNLKNWITMQSLFTFTGTINPHRQMIGEGAYTAEEEFEFIWGRDTQEFLKWINDEDRRRFKKFCSDKLKYMKEHKYEQGFMSGWFNGDTYKSYMQG